MLSNLHTIVAGSSAGVAVYLTLLGFNHPYAFPVGALTSFFVAGSLKAFQATMAEITSRTKPQTPEASLANNKDTRPAP